MRLLLNIKLVMFSITHKCPQSARSSFHPSFHNSACQPQHLHLTTNPKKIPILPASVLFLPAAGNTGPPPSNILPSSFTLPVRSDSLSCPWKLKWTSGEKNNIFQLYLFTICGMKRGTCRMCRSKCESLPESLTYF